MSLFVLLLSIWAVITGSLILLVIYRSIVGLKEDDQLFIGRSEAKFAAEQGEVLSRLNRTEPYVRYLGVASGVLLALIGGLWFYQQWTAGTMIR
jgi:hypothetical protein